MKTRIQLRDHCPICDRIQAVSPYGEIADHGFEIRYGWRQGRCPGSRKPRFGTPDGRNLRESYAAELARIRDARWKLSAELFVIANGGPALDRKCLDYAGKVIEQPSALHWRNYAQRVVWDAESMAGVVTELQKSVREWVAREPSQHVVEASKGPLMHLKGGYGAVCSGSMTGSRGKVTTPEYGAVTCVRCLAKAQALGERKGETHPFGQALGTIVARIQHLQSADER